MAHPVLVLDSRTGDRAMTRRSPQSVKIASLPPVTSYAFSDILKAADSQELQSALDGIAEICAKHNMSLADQYGSHLPPLGEITAATAAANATLAKQPNMLRPGLHKRRLTTVPEGSSSSGSEASRKSKKRRGSLFGLFRAQPEEELRPMRRIRISSIGRTVSVGSVAGIVTTSAQAAIEGEDPIGARRASRAMSSLQRLLDENERASFPC